MTIARDRLSALLEPSVLLACLTVTPLLFIVHTFGQVINDPCLSGRCLTPMKSRGRAVGQSQRDHRLPHGLLDARSVVEPTSSISRDTRSRSPRCGQNELETKREDSEAEEERRGTFLNKWEDDGQDLLDELESNDRMVLSTSRTTLESSQPGAVPCCKLHSWLLHHGQLSYLCRQGQIIQWITLLSCTVL